MKKASTDRKARGPGVASLREMPEIDFADYRVRRNPYAARIKREGIHVAHDEPSNASLDEMPEADFAYARVRPNRYASRAAESVARVQYGKGRPPAGQEVGETSTRSLRLPADVWAALEAEATARKTTVHAILREIVAAHILRRGRG